MNNTDYFAQAESYNTLKLEQLMNVHEKAPSYTRQFRWSERHLQCVWFDQKIRPERLALSSGEILTVVDPGRWNLEAGADFLDAELIVHPSGRIVRGDVEVHIYPADWDSHHHAENPDYDNVALHVTWFSTPPARTIDRSVLTLPLAQPMRMRPWISLDDLDIGAYPHNILPITPRPCQSILTSNPQYAQKLLLSAGYHRMQNKTLAISRRLEDTGDRAQIFYAECMSALGYKQNKTAFRELAGKITFEQLSESRDHNLALLLGTAGLLPQPESITESNSAAYLRSLWDIWWKSGGSSVAEIHWVLHGLRPNNHPSRRLAAASALFALQPTLLQRLDDLCASYQGKAWLKQIARQISEACEWPFWNSRLLFSSSSITDKKYALLGKRRISTLITNVIIPFYAAESNLDPMTFDHLPPEDTSSPMRTAAWYLFGRDHNPAAYYAGNNLLQQGLLQIYLDFCLPARAGCGECRLLQKIRKDLQ
jgi:hypothetical protein